MCSLGFVVLLCSFSHGNAQPQRKVGSQIAKIGQFLLSRERRRSINALPSKFIMAHRGLSLSNPGCGRVFSMRLSSTILVRLAYFVLQVINTNKLRSQNRPNQWGKTVEY